MLVAYSGVALRLLWLSRAWPLVHDVPIMHYVAWRIAGGAVPYRDVFDMNFPGAYLLHLAVLSTLGPGDVAWRLFDLGWLALGALSVAALAAAWGRVASVGGALFFIVYHLAGGAWQAGQRDFLLCPFLLAGALGVVRWAEGQDAVSGGSSCRRVGLASGGLALGAAMSIKPQTGLLLLGLAGVLALAARRRRRSVLPALATLLVPAAVVPALVVAWVAVRGGLPAWRAIVIDYLLPLYARLGRPSSWAFYRWHVWLVIAAVILISLGHALVRGRFGLRHGVVVAGILYGLVHFFGQGKGWEYHLYPLVAFVSVAMFSALDPPGARARVMHAGLAILLVVTLVGLDLRGVEAADPAWIRDKQRRVEAIVCALAGRVAERDTAQVLDTTEGGIHALLRLHAVEPSRFIYDFHFFHDVEHPTIRALRAELVEALTAHPPRFVILLARGWPAGGYERVQQFPELGLLLGAYEVETRAPDYMILARRGADSSPRPEGRAVCDAPAGAGERQ